MKQTKILMGMPISLEIIKCFDKKVFDRVFDYFGDVDHRFSTYKKDSEISKINRGELHRKDFSPKVREVFKLAEQTKKETGGYFNIARPDEKIDPSGIVKGWAIFNAAKILKRYGFKNFYVEAGGDVEVSGLKNKKKWRVGIKNPFNVEEIVKMIEVSSCGVATSGNYARGEHIYNPKTQLQANEIASITIIGPNAYEADRFATAAFAMGGKGIEFIARQRGLEGYMIDNGGIATVTPGFDKYELHR